MILATGKHVLNAVAGTGIALMMIFAADRTVDPIWEEYAEVISLDTDHVVLQLYGNKLRDLKLAKPSNLQAFAIGENGNRRIVSIEPASGQTAASYPRGWTDFGWWKFTDKSPTPRPITKVEVKLDYVCITGVCTNVLGPFAVD